MTERIHSDQFAALARHGDFPHSFTRSRKLPLPALVGVLLSMRNRAQQALLDEFFGSLAGDGLWHQGLTDRSFAKARDRLEPMALSWLNRTLIEQADPLCHNSCPVP